MIPGYLIEFLPFYLNLFKAKVKNWWLTESKAFRMSIVTNIPLKFSKSVVCKTSAIKHPPSLMNLPSAQADWLSEISDARTFLRRFDKALEIIFASKFSREIGLQFRINLLSLSFFSINLIVACLFEVQCSPLSKECETQDKNVFFYFRPKCFEKFFRKAIISRRFFIRYTF